MSYPSSRLPSEFRMAGGGFGRMVAPFVFVLLLGGVLCYVFGYLIGGNLGGWVGAVAGTGVLVGILYVKFARMKSGTVVRFSDYGVELSDQMGFRVRLRWPDVTRVGTVHTQMADPKKIGEDGGLQVSVGAMKTMGLIGWGERITPKRMPGWMRDNLSRVPLNPADGRPEVAIPLGGIDPNWVRGAMGEWVRRHRPDLLGGSQTVAGQPIAGPPPAGQPIAGHPAAGQPATGQPAAGYPAPAGSAPATRPPVRRATTRRPAIPSPATSRTLAIPSPATHPSHLTTHSPGRPTGDDPRHGAARSPCCSTTPTSSVVAAVVVLSVFR